ncbi:MAG: glycosyltransferase family 4 protein [Gemmatimonadetes bacterium]|nr:glycosyltransferase family 4 protein [Gemmatimonadota bacterium]
MRELRVAHVVPAPFGASGGIVGGAERYAFELARHMAAEVPTKLVTFGPEERREMHGDLRVRVLGGSKHIRGLRSNPISLRLVGALRDVNVVHCHQQHVLASSFSAIYARLTGRRVFVTDLGGGGWDISGYVSTDTWYHGHLHISEYSRKIFGHQANPRAHVILGGVDAARFSPSDAIAPTDTALFVGRVLPHKGVNYLIEGLPADLALEIIGRSGDDRYLAELHGLASGKRVTFVHDADDATLVRAYRRAMCVVLPSVYHTVHGYDTRVPELLGQTLLEGMACGVPVICTDVASMPEVVEAGSTGFVVPPNDPAALGEKLRWIHQHPEESRAMGAAGRRRVLERFTWPAVVRRCLAIYRS